MNYSIVSGVLAQILVTLPRITMVDLFERCKDQIGTIGLAEFRLKVSTWLHDGTIPGYETRKGKTGGIYKKGSKTETTAKEPGTQLDVDHTPVAETLKVADCPAVTVKLDGCEDIPGPFTLL